MRSSLVNGNGTPSNDGSKTTSKGTRNRSAHDMALNFGGMNSMYTRITGVTTVNYRDQRDIYPPTPKDKPYMDDLHDSESDYEGYYDHVPAERPRSAEGNGSELNRARSQAANVNDRAPLVGVNGLNGGGRDGVPHAEEDRVANSNPNPRQEANISEQLSETMKIYLASKDDPFDALYNPVEKQNTNRDSKSAR